MQNKSEYPLGSPCGVMSTDLGLTGLFFGKFGSF